MKVIIKGKKRWLDNFDVFWCELENREKGGVINVCVKNLIDGDLFTPDDFKDNERYIEEGFSLYVFNQARGALSDLGYTVVDIN
jgi:hypothetical protein